MPLHRLVILKHRPVMPLHRHVMPLHRHVMPLHRLVILKHRHVIGLQVDTLTNFSIVKHCDRTFPFLQVYCERSH
ncbi:hypothetical protein [Calothrix sp. NIES-2100]|uniref:hypothetical protein n=1 Tax=Calothrix sp. NIES-2100 TaxID=1954172 RepID=UPI0030DB95DB